MTRFVYFAWVRERIGTGEESLDIPADVVTGEDLIAWMKGLGENYAHALEDGLAVRIAIDQQHADMREPIGRPGEIAIFPPMTGG